MARLNISRIIENLNRTSSPSDEKPRAPSLRVIAVKIRIDVGYFYPDGTVEYDFRCFRLLEQ
jgi:hypothetical protein